MRLAGNSCMEDSGAGAAIILFVRLPVPGRVKTRLAAGVGAGAACDFYRACASAAMRTCASLAGPRLSLVVQHSSGDASDGVRAWVDDVLGEREVSARSCVGGSAQVHAH